MLTTKKAGAVVALAAVLCGCTPPGPRALLKGEKLLHDGDAAAALAQFKEATTHLPQFAPAWNHLGLAHHALGQSSDAARAYRQALTLDPNLAAVRFNFGCLLLEHNNAPAAMNELASFTLQRPNAAEGWLQRGRAELQARQFDAAERSFRNATTLSPRLAPAHNGLGIAQLSRNRPLEAHASFQTASQSQPAFAPALLNLAIVTHQHIAPRQPEFRAHALQRYRDYAALPSVPHRDAVAQIVKALDAEWNPPRVAAAKPAPAVTNAAPAVAARAPETNGVTAKPPTAANNPPLLAANTTKSPSTAAPKVRPGELPPFNPGATIETPVTPPQPVAVAPPKPVVSAPPLASATFATSPLPRVATSNPAPPPRTGSQLPPFTGTNPAAPATPSAPTETKLPVPAPARPVAESSGGDGARYAYRNPSRPAPGNRFAAENHFAQAEEQRDRGRWADALGHYEKAITADPAFFEAHFYIGMMADKLGLAARAPVAYETALALQPASLSARFNFALVLEKAGHIRDAATELERLLTDYPDADRAHLALANIYTKRLNQQSAARQHYLRVLEINPQHPQGTDIRYWLRDHPQ